MDLQNNNKVVNNKTAKIAAVSSASSRQKKVKIISVDFSND